MFTAVLLFLTELPVLSSSFLTCEFIYIFILLFCMRFLPSLQICVCKKLKHKSKTLFMSITNEDVSVADG